MREPIARGAGPWPPTNEEQVVHAWMVERLGPQWDRREARQIARLCLDAVSGTTRGERLVQGYAFRESELDVLAIQAQRIRRGEPTQYVLGNTAFDGLMLVCDHRALIPRPETEELVVRVSDWLQERGEESAEGFRILDVGTGSGCLALALARRFPQAQVTGLDVSEDALDLARENGLVQGLDVDWLHRDFLRSWADLGAFDVVISNPPYIPQRERLALASHVIHHEPALALFVPDERPLLHYEALTHAAEHGLLHPGGLLAMECHTDFVADVAALGTPESWRLVNILEDLQRRPRFVLRERWPD